MALHILRTVLFRMGLRHFAQTTALALSERQFPAQMELVDTLTVAYFGRDYRIRSLTSSTRLELTETAVLLLF